MVGTDDSKEKKTLSLTKRIELNKIERDQVRQSFSHGRSKTVEVEVKRRRVLTTKSEDRSDEALKESPFVEIAASKKLTEGEFGNRLDAIRKAVQDSEEREHEKSLTQNVDVLTSLSSSEDSEKDISVDHPLEGPVGDDLKQVPVSVVEKPRQKRFQPIREKLTAESILRDLGSPVQFNAYRTERPSPVSSQKRKDDVVVGPQDRAPSSKPHEPRRPPDVPTAFPPGQERGGEQTRHVRKKTTLQADVKKNVTSKKGTDSPVRKLTRQVLTKVLEDGLEERSRSIAALKRARQKQKHQKGQFSSENVFVVRDVIIPDTILVSELANRMAVRGADVVKSLMKMGVMATLNQSIDGDTAELICSEFGHTPKRVSDALEILSLSTMDDPGSLKSRPPVVVVMGHVDHGKTSLLDALRKTDVVLGEAGGITQHIGAYQVTLNSGKHITFIDTPGHAAFTEMRARGANITDVVVLVVAADDGIKEQTIEAIRHAKAAKVPIVVAINKMDRPGADPDRVRHELLNHELVVEEFGGEVIAVEISAYKKTNLDKLEEAILLQAEILDLKANPDREGEGIVIEAKMDKGRGPVATVLVRRGTLKVGDVFVGGTEFGRVRTLVDSHGEKIQHALPSTPVEVVGFNGVPFAGDDFVVVPSESEARELTEYRQRLKRERKNQNSARGTLEQMMSKISEGKVKELAVVIKADVQGSTEAIVASLLKLATSEVSVRILHSGVGAINESDVILARASDGIVLGFNVRANPQARESARRDGTDIRYYSIIYDILDDARTIMSGLLSPELKENYLGTAEIRNIFEVTKVGRVAGCFVTDGVVRRGSKVRLLRDLVVIHEGVLKTLRRFKDEVKEVKNNYECGMAFENYQDIQVGDTIECFDVQEIARQI